MIDYKKNNDKFYGSISKKKGIKKVGWNSKKSQWLRFAMLARIGDMNNKTILDVGCGRGDFVRFCKDKKIKFGGYQGIDLYEHKFNRAPNVFFTTADILNKEFPIYHNYIYDYIIASGTFNLKKNKAMTKRMIKRCFELCRKGFAFNLPSDETKRKFRNPVVAYYNAEEMFNYCRKLSKHVHLIRGYLPHDFTIYMRK
jgi:SAM-dependent methyltransferase